MQPEIKTGTVSNWPKNYPGEYPKLEELSDLKFLIKVSEFVGTCLHELVKTFLNMNMWKISIGMNNMFELVVQNFPSCSKLVYILFPMSIAVSIGLKLPPPPKKNVCAKLKYPWRSPKQKCLKDNTGTGSIIFLWKYQDQ